MTYEEKTFWTELHARTANFDLLKHPFYQAWREGKLTRSDLAEYAAEYYPQVARFPVYLDEFQRRLPQGQLQEAVVRNLQDELGEEATDGAGNDPAPSQPHHRMWLDFAAAMGASPQDVPRRAPTEEMHSLDHLFLQMAEKSSPAALAAFYAYESQVPRIAAEKLAGLRQHYGVDEQGSRYFSVHAVADIVHSGVWRAQLNAALNRRPELAGEALAAAEDVARALWLALDGIERRRRARNGLEGAVQ